MEDALEIFCDEAGSTGPALLDPDQPLFAFASVQMSDEEARAIIEEGLKRHPVQMPELKAAKLLRTDRGRSLVVALVEAAEGRFAVSVHDKLLALCACFFEYIYEPVFKTSPWLLYEKHLHRFVAMIMWVWFKSKEKDTHTAISQFQAYMRTLDEKEAPLLFASVHTLVSSGEPQDPFESILRFARGYRDAILAENALMRTALPNEGRWVLDLSATSLWSHLNHWGERQLPLHVSCDASKPLKSIIAEFTGDANDPGILRARDKGSTQEFGWKYASRPSFVDSRDHPAIQLADVIAGAANFVAGGHMRGESRLGSLILNHGLRHCIVPDAAIVDPGTREAAVNAAMLYRLAWKAEQRLDPHDNLEQEYKYAEAQWDSGAYRLESE
jgi:hypothetical protein